MRDFKYILKRILIGVGIALALMFLKGTFVHAKTYYVSNDSSVVTYYSSYSTSVFNFGVEKTTPSGQGMNGILFKLNLDLSADQYNMLQAGSYLFDFYVVSTRLDGNLTKCKDLSTDYRFIDKTSGNTISAASSSKSSCINSYYTTFDGKDAIHYLVQYTITNTASYPYFTDELRFQHYLFHGVGFTQTDSTFMIVLGNLQDYDASVVSDFNSFAQGQAIQSSIDYQTQVQHNDSVNTQNTLTDDNVTGAEGKLNDLINDSSFQDSSGINAIINAPLNFIQGLSSTCTPIQVTIPFIDTSVTLPCIVSLFYNKMPTLANILSVAINGFVVYRILLDIVHLVKAAREPDDDRIEVLDL